METIQVDSSNSTTLNDRVLWYDGDSTVSEEHLIQLILNGLTTGGLFVNEITTEIAQYNQFVPKEKKISVKEDIRPLQYDWNIPDEYKDIDVGQFVAVAALAEECPTDDFTARAERVQHEMDLYEKLGLTDVLRTLIYVINTLIENNVVWGVGRGSSVSSYVLYLIGVHDVDSFKYGLNIEEFLRTE